MPVPFPLLILTLNHVYIIANNQPSFLFFFDCKLLTFDHDISIFNTSYDVKQ